MANLSSTAVIAAAPVLVNTNDHKEPEKPVQKLAWGKNIKPPSMVLDENVNGFKSNRKNKNGGQGKGRKKKARILSSPLCPVIESFDRTRMRPPSLLGTRKSLTILLVRTITTNIRHGN